MPAPASQIGVAHDQAPQAAYAYVIRYSNSAETVCLTGWEQSLTINNPPAFLGLANPQVFTPAQISHGEQNNGANYERRDITVLLGVNDDRLKRYFATASAEKIAIYIMRLSAPKLLTGEVLEFSTDGFLLTSGVIGKIGIEGVQIAAQLTPEPFLANQNIPRHFFSRTCNHNLGGQGCTVVMDDFKLVTTIAAIDSAKKIIELSHSAPGGSPEFFRAGYMVHAPTGVVIGITWSDSEGFAGNARLRLHFWSLELEVGQTITAFAGCRHTVADCQDKFNNVANFGGFPYSPNRSPFLHGVR